MIDTALIRKEAKRLVPGTLQRRRYFYKSIKDVPEKCDPRIIPRNYPVIIAIPVSKPWLYPVHPTLNDRVPFPDNVSGDFCHPRSFLSRIPFAMMVVHRATRC